MSSWTSLRASFSWLEREGVTAQLNNNSGSIEAKLVEVEEKQKEQEQEQGSLHCSWCRGDYTRLYNRDHHRWVTELSSNCTPSMSPSSARTASRVRRGRQGRGGEG